MIQFESVIKTYAKASVRAVDDINLTIQDGEIFGFLGPNGAGKTTTIKLLTGILSPDSGRITIDGHDIQKNALEAKRRFGLVPDNPEVFGRLKAIEYLNFMADVYEVPTDVRRERIEDLTRRFGISDVLSARISSFSHGMKQKLIITGSLLHDPHNWFLDEPMVGLDPASSFSLKEMMRSRTAAGKTVFFSTHVMEVAEKVCDRIGIISRGKLLFVGTVEELKTRSGDDSSLENLFLELVDSDTKEPEAVK